MSRLSGLLGLTATLALAVPAPGAEHSALGRHLQERFRAAVQADGPATAFVVVKNGRVVSEAALGLADMELGVPAKPDSVFPIGSTTKSFTAALVLRLAREGRLSLDAPLEKHVPGFPRGDALTLRHLLAHQSGIQDYLPAVMKRACVEGTTDDVLAMVRDLRPLFPPGEAWSYSNTNYILLGQVIERATGQSFEDVLAARLLKPLALDRTSAPDDGVLVPGRVKLHAHDPARGWSRAPAMSRSWTGAAGEIQSTARELAAWGEAWLAGLAVDPADRSDAWREQLLADGTPSGYGLGWFVATHDGLVIVEHGGNVAGGTAELVIVPERRVVVALLHAGHPTPLQAADLARRLALEAAGSSEPARPVPVELTEQQLAALTGTYAFPDVPRTVFLREGAPRLRWNELTDAVLIPVSPTSMVSVSGSSRLDFALGSSGAASRVTLSGFSLGRQVARRMEVPPPARLSGTYRSVEGLEARIEERDAEAWVTLTGVAGTMRLRPALDGTFLVGYGAQETTVLFDLASEGPAPNVTFRLGRRTISANRVP